MANIPVIEAIVLGLVQGLTEFLPISSSAHLKIVPLLLHYSDPGAAYSAVIQLGSVLAVFIYFFNDIKKLFLGSLTAIKQKDLNSFDLRLSVAIILGTIPICVIGLALKHILESDSSPLRAPLTIAYSSIFMGLFLLLAEKLGKRSRTINNLGVRDGVLTGIGQCLALIPGCSRSGSTITVALLLNLKREDAARFSFLLGLPAVLLSGLLELKSMLEQKDAATSLLSLNIGFIVSAIVSYFSIAFLIKYLMKHSTIVFVIYRIIFGLSIILFMH